MEKHLCQAIVENIYLIMLNKFLDIEPKQYLC